MHGLYARGHYMHVPRMGISRVAIPRVAHDKLHETCMFHATRKRGARKHVMGLFKVLSWCHACKNEVIIEQYRSYLLASICSITARILTFPMKIWYLKFSAVHDTCYES